VERTSLLRIYRAAGGGPKLIRFLALEARQFYRCGSFLAYALFFNARQLGNEGRSVLAAGITFHGIPALFDQRAQTLQECVVDDGFPG
jgi:hypothetical protein